MIKALLVMTQPILSTDAGPAHTAVLHALGATLLLLIEATQGQQEAPAGPPGMLLIGLSLQEEQDSRKTLPPQPS